MDQGMAWFFDHLGYCNSQKESYPLWVFWVLVVPVIAYEVHYIRLTGTLLPVEQEGQRADILINKALSVNMDETLTHQQ
jgi:hypothetical protein